MEREITLAIETAVAGGSLSLFDGDLLIDEWVGKREVSRSEELITEIAEILKCNRLERRDLRTLAVSRGPGSYTGARIGLATAIGLRDGLNIKCFGVSVLDAFFNSFFNAFSDSFAFSFTLQKQTEDHKFDMIAAVSFGKREVCFQSFTNRIGKKETEQAFQPRIITFETFKQIIAGQEDTVFITNEKLYSDIKNSFTTEGLKIFNAGENLSRLVGQIVINQDGSDNLRPIYPYSN